MQLNLHQDSRWVTRNLHVLQVSFDDTPSKILSQRRDAAKLLNESISVPLISDEPIDGNMTGACSAVKIIR